MTFIKYTNDGKAVIQPAALTLSNLDNEDALEMHTLNTAIVLLKENMTPMEKFFAFESLVRLMESLAVELEADTDDDTDDDSEADDTVNICDGMISIPGEAFDMAGIWGKDLNIRSLEGAVVITEDISDEDKVDALMNGMGRAPYDLAVLLNVMNNIVRSGDADA